jgi:hypothetical protein
MESIQECTRMRGRETLWRNYFKSQRHECQEGNEHGVRVTVFEIGLLCIIGAGLPWPLWATRPCFDAWGYMASDCADLSA